MRHHPARMNSGVGPARAVDCDIGREKLSKCPLKIALHGAAILLQLPAGEFRAVVFDQEREFHQGVSGG
jgi:hypothetical protein